MSESYEMTGTIKEIFDPLSFESGFKKREFVITTDGEYPQDVKFELTSGAKSEKDKTKVLDSFSIGDSVTVKFDIRGNEYKDRYYVNLNAFYISSDEAGRSSRPKATSKQEPLPDLPDMDEDEDEDDGKYPF